MATISKTQRAQSVTYRAIVKRNGVVVKTKCFKTRTAARLWAKRVESDAELIEALGEKGARLTLSEVARQYLEDWSGRAHSRKYQINWWVAQLGTSSLSSVSVDDVRRCLDDYHASRVKHWAGNDAAGRPLLKEGSNTRAPATVNRMKAALSALYKYAARKGYTTRNPARQVAAQPEQNKRIRFLSDVEREQLLVACRESTWPKLYLLVITAIMTGARKGELKSLRWEQIDFEHRRATQSDSRMDLEAYGRIVRIADPQISPDGRTIVVTVGRRYESKGSRSDL